MMTTNGATIDISEARAQIAHLGKRLRDEGVIWVTKHNKKVFAAVDAETMQALMDTIEVLQDSEALKMLQQSLDDIRMGRLHDHEDVKRELLR